MGAFCVACCVSGQTIADYDECLVVPLGLVPSYEPVRLKHRESTFERYAVGLNPLGAHWHPLGGVVAGTYADSGKIKPSDTPTNRRVMVEFFVTLVCEGMVTEPGEVLGREPAFDLPALLGAHAPTLAQALRRTRDVPADVLAEVPFAEFSRVWERMWEVMQRNRLFVRAFNQEPRPVQFAILHRVAFETLVARAESLTSWDGQPYALQTYLLHILKRSAEPINGRIPNEFMQMSRLQDELRLGLSTSDGVRRLVEPFHGELSAAVSSFQKGDLDEEALVARLVPMLSGVYVRRAMVELHLEFSPIRYVGQDYDNSQGRNFIAFASSVAQSVSAQRLRMAEE